MDYQLTRIALCRLCLSPHNPRKTPASPEDHDAMVASLTHGPLIYPLIVDPHDEDSDAIGVVAGGRRLAAFNTLAEQGTIPSDHPIPCYIRPEGIDPTEIALLENTMRAGMHPADQFESFQVLAASGEALSDIADRFGVGERTVERRLRLAKVAPELIAAYRAGDMRLETLEAFTRTDDHAFQVQIWDAARRQLPYDDYQTNYVRRALVQERMHASHPVAQYAGIDKYTKAGGRITRDLFAREDREIILDDPAIAIQVATERLEAHAARLRPKWGWVETSVEPVHYVDLNRFGHARPQPTHEEGARLEAIAARIEEIYDMDDLGEQEHDELKALRVEDNAIRAAVGKRPLSEEARGRAGCLITIEQGGKARVHQGLVRPEDLPREPSEEGGDEVTPPVRLNPSAGRVTFYSAVHAANVRSLRTAAVKAKLARYFEVAFDLVLYELATQLMPGRSRSSAQRALSLSVHPTDHDMQAANQEAFQESAALHVELLEEAGARLPADALESGSSDVTFAALSALEPEHKQAIFAYCIAQLVPHQLSFDAGRTAALEAAIERLDIEPHLACRPGAAFFWSRLRKGQSLDIAGEVIGPSWVERHQRDRKSDLGVFLEQIFRDPATDPEVPAQAYERIHAWSMPGLRAFGPDPMAAGEAEDGSATDPTEEPAEGQEAPTGGEALPAFLEH